VLVTGSGAYKQDLEPYSHRLRYNRVFVRLTAAATIVWARIGLYIAASIIKARIFVGVICSSVYGRLFGISYGFGF
jgi:hypothetical protein